MKFLIWIRDFFTHLIRRILQIVLTLTITIVCGIIYIVTLEPGTRKRPTIRKCKRIRALTKFKLYVYKYCTPLCKFMHNNYLEQLYNKFHFLID